MDEPLKDMVNNRAMNFEIRQYARQNLGMRTLREDALIRAAQGLTTTSEVLAHTDKFDDDQD